MNSTRMPTGAPSVRGGGRSRRGFTLIEVMIAIVISSVVVLLAYRTLRAGLDVQDRVTQARDANEGMTAVRAMLQDALRHAVEGGTADLPGLAESRDADGRLTQLAFASRGVVPPLGGSGLWRVALAADADGVRVDATPVDGGRAPLQWRVVGAAQLRVRYLERADAPWTEAWREATRVPLAIEVQLLDRDGHDVGAPLVARTQPMGGA